MPRYKFTSESVSKGHPDKVCDQISDAVLDAALEQEPNSKVACETLVKSKSENHQLQHHVIIAGEITTSKELDYKKIAQGVIKDIGYDADQWGFKHDCAEITLLVNEQAKNIQAGVEKGDTESQGAGDQGLMFGFACDETDVLMPWPITYAHRLVQKQAEVRKSSGFEWMGPDAKSQVTVEYDGNEPVRVDTVVLSTQHRKDIDLEQVREAVIEEIIEPVIPPAMMCDPERIKVNPAGEFFIGGPEADCGLTGRKIIVDTYGGMSRHGGGAFSGKDPSKVDRSAAYAMRHVAKNIVAAKIAKRCEVQVSYAIGDAKPTSVMVNTFGTGICDDEKIEKAVSEVFDLRPGVIIRNLQLKRPIYQNTAAYGHFGREEDSFTWELTDKVDELLDFCT